MLFYRIPREERTRRARAALDEIGLGSRMHHRPSNLSGGEQQRVALARALVKGPRILFADEPTGNLDQANADQLAHTLAERNKAGISIVLVTHDPALAAEDADRTVRMHYGRIVEESARRPGGVPSGAPRESAAP
jgi:predicted ABC-type transport system involved in lysophospholipase L1 biosynthesis ATPase subunit